MAILIDGSKVLGLLGANGERWIQGAWGDEQSMCLHGAIRRCQPYPGDAYLVEQVACQQGWGTDWNDDENTHWVDVRERIARIEITDADLADTFGPQWEQIVALVRRAAVLTVDEAERLAAAWAVALDTAGDSTWDAARAAAGDAAWAVALDTAGDSTWDAAWAAWDATWAAARDAALDVARDAARDAALDATWAAWNAAGVAARALAARDIIGQHGFTQDHYDLLTGPWRTVIGPVHPDDDHIAGDTH
jgi:hypothetical protein